MVRGEKLTFPVLERIDLLVTQLDLVSRTAPRDAALYAWSLVEHTKSGLINLPHEPSLLNFKKTVLQALALRGLHDISNCLNAASWDSPESSPGQHGEPEKHRSASLSKEPEQVLAQQTPAQHPLLVTTNEKLDHIAGLISDYERGRKILTARVNELASSISPCQTLEELKSQVEYLSGSLVKLRIVGADAHAAVWLEGCTAAEVVKLQLIAPTLSDLAPNGFESWSRQLKRLVNELTPFLDIIDQIKKKPASVRERLFRHISSEPIATQYAERHGQSLLTQINTIEAGVAAQEHFLREIEAKFLDFKWNPLAPNSFTSADWTALGNFFIYEETYDARLGITLRMEYESLANKFATKLDYALDQISLESFERFLDVLRCLTLGQIEALDRGTKSIRHFLAIVELHAYLETSEFLPTEAFGYWSASPLNEHVAQQSDDPFAQFIQTIFTRSGGSNSHRLTLADLRHYLLNRPLAHSGEISVDEQAPMIEQLTYILRYHKRGGNTYAELWSQAHGSLFAPIKATLDAGHIDRVVEAIRKLEVNSDIENHLPSWKTAIAEHLRKRSEYDKHIRAQVRSKIEELSNWANGYESTAKAKSASNSIERDSLQAAIEKVYAARDHCCMLLQTWFNLLILNKGKKEIPWCMSPSRSRELTFEALADKTSPFLPRSIGKQQISFADVLGDRFISSQGFNTASQLAFAYADQHLYESYFALTANSTDILLPDLDRKVEAEIDDLAQAQERRIESLQNRQKSLSDPSEDFQSYLLELNRYLFEQQWEVLDRELGEVERLVLNLETQRVDRSARETLRADIKRLGGSAPDQASLQQLTAIYDQLYKDTAPRRKHIEPLRLFLTTEDVLSEVAASAKQAISELESSAVLPSPTHSEYLSYVLEQAVLPLAGELSRHRTLLPVYSSRLRRLTLTLITNSKAQQFLTEDNSPLLGLLEETADIWKSLPRAGEKGIGALEGKFVEYGIPIFEESATAQYEIGRPLTPDVAASNSGASVSRIARKMKSADLGGRYDRGSESVNDAELNNTIQSKEWAVAANIAAELYNGVELKTSRRGIDLLTNWAVSSLMYSTERFELEEIAATLHLINLSPNAAAFRAISSTKHSRGVAGEIIVRFVRLIAHNMGLSADKTGLIDQLQFISSNISYFSQYRSLFELSFAPPSGSDSAVLRTLWDYFSGDGRQAESRSSLMNLLWACSMPSGLACCLTYPPTEMPRRKADALADIAVQAFEQGKLQLLQSFIDLRKSLSSKPFQLFVDAMLKRIPLQSEQPAALTLLGKVERRGSANELHGLIEIVGRSTDCPDTISVALSTLAPVRFKNSSLEMTLIGPFIEATTLEVEFVLLDQNAVTFNLDLSCSALSITGRHSRFTTTISIDLSEIGTFNRLSSDDLDEAFSGFPEYQMRGTEYVPRWDDERRIERALFSSKTVRSIWIASPRRSGKTTMLYKILDSYSHRVGRDSAVAYLTLDKSFDESVDFNSWLWTRLRTIPANKELRERYENFAELGKDLPWTADAGTFVGALADRLLQSRDATSRVIFLIDEVDKFASMYFYGGARREAAIDIMWQLRQLIGERRDIGFVFAGSSAAKRIFVTNSDAPFFNGITLLELTPFSCKTVRDEESARAIVQPQKVAGKHNLPRASLEHLLWVCAGIPYYMKLVSGATMGIARQSHILISDVNDGLRALLSKSTGVTRLDDMTGDPGSDELRTMAIENGTEKLFTLAVLYSIAEMYSPLGGHTILRSNLTATDSPLIARYGFTKKMIDRGLQLCIELGLLRLSSEKQPEISFAIPILGESIRHSCGRLWSAIDHELRAIGELETASDA
jgi:hypothetical protein